MTSGARGAEGTRPRVWGALLLLLGLGVAFRLRFLDEGSLFIDEGESTLNALSILEHGYPADHYQGLPMFENTLTEPWPESAEYEFRDTSYSTRGMAIYHGWLPLYAIAASLALHGIGPDPVLDPPAVQHEACELRTRIRAVRLPAVAFGALFILAMFMAGRPLYGVDAGLCAALLAALVPKCIWLAQQARYYSAGLAFSALAIVAALRVHERGRWRDFLLAGVAFVLLFHSSSLAFAIVLVPCLVLLPSILRREGAWPRLAAWAGVVILGLVPWMLWTGYLERAAHVPMARTLLAFPRDYLVYFSQRPKRAVFGALVFLGFVLLVAFRRRLPARVAEQVEAMRLPLVLLVTWILAAFLGFQVLVPAASCSMARLSHLLLAAPILLAAIGFAFLGRVLVPRASPAFAAVGALAVLAGSGRLLHWQRRNPFEAQAAFQMVEHLRTREFRSDTRLYALPYQHFCLSYYTGLPIQSIAPVRREFLSSYPGEIVILETTSRLPSPRWGAVQRLTAQAGVTLEEGEGLAWIRRLHAAMVRAEVTPLVRSVQPEPGPEPQWFALLVADLRREAESSGLGRTDYAVDNPAMFAGRPPMTSDEFWPAFFYRFVDPETRTGAHLNYAERMRSAAARILPSTWIVLTCPPLWEVER